MREFTLDNPHQKFTYTKDNKSKTTKLTQFQLTLLYYLLQQDTISSDLINKPDVRKIINGTISDHQEIIAAYELIKATCPELDEVDNKNLLHFFLLDATNTNKELFTRENPNIQSIKAYLQQQLAPKTATQQAKALVAEEAAAPQEPSDSPLDLQALLTNDDACKYILFLVAMCLTGYTMREAYRAIQDLIDGHTARGTIVLSSMLISATGAGYAAHVFLVPLLGLSMAGGPIGLILCAALLAAAAAAFTAKHLYNYFTAPAITVTSEVAAAPSNVKVAHQDRPPLGANPSSSLPDIAKLYTRLKALRSSNRCAFGNSAAIRAVQKEISQLKTENTHLRPEPASR